MTAIRRAVEGSKVLVIGWRFLSQHPHLRKWMLLPLLLDLSLLVFGWTFGISQVPVWTTNTLSLMIVSPGFWFNVLYYPLLIVLGLGFLGIWLYVVFILASVIAAPFNSLLAEKCLRQLSVNTASGAGVGFLFRMLKVSLVKAMVFSVLGVGFFIASLIPGLNLLSLYGMLVIMAYDSADYSYEALGFGFRRRMRELFGNMPEFSGMAGILSLTFIIPGLTLLLLPLAVVGSAVIMGSKHKAT